MVKNGIILLWLMGNGYTHPVRTLSRLLRGITANNNGDFYFWAVYIHFA